MSYRLLVVGGAESAENVSALLKGAGYKEIHLVHDAEAAVQSARSFMPDVVLAEMDLPDADTVSMVKDLLADRPVPVVVHASFDHIDKVKDAEALGASAYIFRPLSREGLMGAIELGISRFRQCQALHTELGDCREALRVRKLVERAKGILMTRSSMSEEEAFLKLQKLSRNNNISMEKVAQSIITASELI